MLLCRNSSSKEFKVSKTVAPSRERTLPFHVCLHSRRGPTLTRKLFPIRSRFNSILEKTIETVSEVVSLCKTWKKPERVAMHLNSPSRQEV